MAVNRLLRMSMTPRIWGLVTLVVLGLAPQALRAARRHRRHTAAAHRRHAREAFVPSVDQRVVAHGDTLWTLCGEVTGKPWQWPQVWALNPSITNPHWLYPGTVVRFVPNAATRQRAVTVANLIDLPTDEPDVQDIAPVPGAHQAPAVEVVDGGPQAPDTRPRSLHVFAGNFISRQELEDAGQLSNAAPDKILLRAGDDLFLSFKPTLTPKLGDRFYLFRTANTVKHPLSGATWGYLTEITGWATVTELNHGVARARLDHTVLEVERGQRVMPYTEDFLLDVTPTGRKSDVAGVILAVQGARSAVGEQSLVFVDKGRNDGIERGTELSVLSRADLLTGIDAKLPTQDMATLMVVDAKETTATCLVVDALYEIWPGDRFRGAPGAAP